MILTVAWINVGDCHQEARTKVSQQLSNPSFLRWRHQKQDKQPNHTFNQGWINTVTGFYTCELYGVLGY